MKYNKISDVLDQGEQNLINSGTDQQTAKLEASVLLSHILAKPKSYLLTWPDKQLTTGQIAMYATIVQRRTQGEPISYITGQKEFFSLLFKVTPEVLIPRPETELLVEYILNYFDQDKKIKILDLGTGSGVIAVSIAKTRLEWNITAIDKSSTALKVAQENAKSQKVDNIEFILTDWFDDINLNTKYDCIVANPPYIAANDKHLDDIDITYEPRSALVADNNGLADIEKILTQAKDYLNPQGVLLIEHGYQQVEDIKAMYNKLNTYTSFESVQDYSGLDRFVVIK